MPYITDNPTKTEIQVLLIVNKYGSIRDYRLYKKLKPLRKDHIIAPYDLRERGFITTDDGSKGSKTHTITPMGIAYIELYKARKNLDQRMQSILRESRENYSDHVKERIKKEREWREKQKKETHATDIRN